MRDNRYIAVGQRPIDPSQSPHHELFQGFAPFWRFGPLQVDIRPAGPAAPIPLAQIWVRMHRTAAMAGNDLSGHPGPFLVACVIGVEHLVLQLRSGLLRLRLAAFVQLRAHNRLNDFCVVVKGFAMANEIEAIRRSRDAAVLIGKLRHLLMPLGGIHRHHIPCCCLRLAASDSRHTVRLRR